MDETLSAQVISMPTQARGKRGRLLDADTSVVKGETGAVKAGRTSSRAQIDLLRPPFEAEQGARLHLWLRRWLWRRRLHAAFRYEADGALEDFGLSRERLDRYLARPFWRA
jgi:uncharacterized protein YjiS (DUF1127 family)